MDILGARTSDHLLCFLMERFEVVYSVLQLFHKFVPIENRLFLCCFTASRRKRVFTPHVFKKLVICNIYLLYFNHSFWLDLETNQLLVFLNSLDPDRHFSYSFTSPLPSSLTTSHFFIFPSYPLPIPTQFMKTNSHIQSMQSIISLCLFLLHCILFGCQFVHRFHQSHLNIVSKGKILIRFFFYEGVHFCADILAQSIKEGDIFTDIGCLFLHEGDLILVVSLEACSDTEMDLFVVYVSTTSADGFAFLSPAKGTEGSFADAWTREVVFGTVTPSLHMPVNVVQPFLKKGEHCLFACFRLKGFDDIGQETLALYGKFLRIRDIEYFIDCKRIRSLYVNVLLNSFLDADLLGQFVLFEVVLVLGVVKVLSLFVILVGVENGTRIGVKGFLGDEDEVGEIVQ